MDSKLSLMKAIKKIVSLLKNDYDIEVQEKHINPLFQEKIETIDEELNKITTHEYISYLNIDRLSKIRECFTSDKQTINGRNLIVIKRVAVRENCPNYDLIGDCEFRDCLICLNCDYKIMTDEGEVIQDFIYPESEYTKTEFYIIELNEKVNGNLIEYFLNGTSDYGIIRSDKAIEQLVKKYVKRRVSYDTKTKRNI